MLLNTLVVSSFTFPYRKGMKDPPVYPDPQTGDGEARREPGAIRRSEGVDTTLVQVATENGAIS